MEILLKGRGIHAAPFFMVVTKVLLIYIFLSNRVYPDAEPNKLSKSGIRLHVHRAVYEGLGIK